ncbi:hypothetical protein DSS19_19405 [Salmonella enterica subsp. enterica serovar Abony]|nr:hypothetical protein [Salmonella enterica subsp. enterica serovar Abony]
MGAEPLFPLRDAASGLPSVYRQFTVSLPNTATCHFSFSFSDEHLFPAEFFKLLFLLIWYHWRQPLRDAGHLRPATRSEANSFSFTEEDFPLLPPPFRHLPVLQ